MFSDPTVRLRALAELYRSDAALWPRNKELQSNIAQRVSDIEATIEKLRHYAAVADAVGIPQ